MSIKFNINFLKTIFRYEDHPTEKVEEKAKESKKKDTKKSK